MKKLSSLLFVCCALVMVGCAGRLEQGGAYAPVVVSPEGEVVAVEVPDFKFYTADAAFDVAYSIIDAAFTFERDNRQFLWRVSPSIKRELDKIRPQAVAAKKKWAIARSAYLAAPVPANLDALATALAEIQRLQSTATAVITPTSIPSPPKP